METASTPGGIANYLGRFFTQFFIYAGLGAFIVSAFLLCIQQLLFAIVRRLKKDLSWTLLTFLPAIAYWYLLCDENSQFGGLIALVMSLAFAWLGTLFKSNRLRNIYLLVMIPAVYWICGGATALFAALILLYEWLMRKQKRKTTAWLAVAAALLVTVCPFIAKFFLQEYPLYRFWWGVDYIHFVYFPPTTMLFLWVLILLVVVAICLIPNVKKEKNQRIALLINIIFIGLISFLWVGKNGYAKNISKEEIMAYDYHCRMKNWDEIIRMADKKSPSVPMTVTCLNLALYKTGQLSEKMFHYFQNGPEGLLPSFRRDFMIPMVGGEPYYYLGFVNTAQRYAFEAMESLPDYQKSVRSIKRLAETNLINGKYKTAEKYLHLLENTLFYKAWAKETRTHLYDEAKINAHPEWGEIRRFRTHEDFLFSEREKDMMLGMLFQQHRDNRMAYEYLMAYTLLEKNTTIFHDYFRMPKDFDYPSIPKSYQEALIYIWGLSHDNLSDIPYPISNSVKQNVEEYAGIYTTSPAPEPLLKKRFQKTYWYYLHFREYKKAKIETQYQY
ncbi:hypothetical protein FACS189426_20110 [Bacteroidia bacterium]|nr:hypothetical protein FACS189426_20110 [Bacteroidia bacterium]GHV70224.1 hypothetical protein FACS189420_0430 [Bacteroidia bacterium]